MKSYLLLKQNKIKQNLQKQVAKLKSINMNKRQQQQFIYFFDELCQAQQVIDSLKIDLLHRPGYNPHILFELLSQGNEQIIISQMRKYLSERISCSHRQLYEIFQKFDSKRNGYISRENFVRQLTPFRMTLPHQNQSGIMSSQIQTSFLEIIIEMLKRFRIIDQARKEIVFIQPWQAFAHLDSWKKGIIGLGDLDKFYRDNQFQIGQSSLQFLLHSLRRRYHRDVTLELFCETLNPLQFGEYSKFAEQMSKQNEKEFLKRSRIQQEAVRRSRVDNQLFEYELQRAERRKKAEIERQLNLQDRVNYELNGHDQQQQNLIQRAILEEERDIRNRSLLNHSILDRDYLRSVQESRRFKEIELLKEQQRLINDNLSRKIAQQQAVLNASNKRSYVDNQIAIQQQIEREKETQRLISRQRDEQLLRRRNQPQVGNIRDRQVLIRQLQRERNLRSSHPEVSSVSRNIKQSRIQQLEHELERTRAEMRERRERLEMEDKHRLLKTSTKSKVSAFQY